MDDRAPFTYVDAMRLLLLLSALIAVLAGVGESRAVSSQPVATNICMAGKATLGRAREIVVAAVAAFPARFRAADTPTWWLGVPSLHRPYPIYADRRRE